MREIKRIFVHCTAGPQTQTVAEIQKYWKTVNKWTSPGYHYIVKPDGEIVPLQPEDKPSNGVAGYNSTSINVCYIGGVDKQGRPVDNRTEAQKESLRTILKELKTRYPDAVIMGHREIWGTSPKNWKKMCPCFNAGEEYKDITSACENATVYVPKPDKPIIPEYEPKPIQIPDKPIVPEYPIESTETSTSGEKDQIPSNRPKSRSSIVDFVVKLLSKLFSHGK